jgi:hypothetical protein
VQKGVFHPMPQLIQSLIVQTFKLSIGLGRYNGLCALPYSPSYYFNGPINPCVQANVVPVKPKRHALSRGVRKKNS